MSSLTISFAGRVRTSSLLLGGGRSENLFSQHVEKALQVPLCFSRSFRKCPVPSFPENKVNKATHCFVSSLLHLKEKQIISGNLCSQMYPGNYLWRSGIMYNYTCLRVSFVLPTCKQILMVPYWTPKTDFGFLLSFLLSILDGSLSFLVVSIRNHCKNPGNCYSYFLCFWIFNFHWRLLFSFPIAYIPV